MKRWAREDVVAFICLRLHFYHYIMLERSETQEILRSIEQYLDLKLFVDQWVTFKE